MALKEIASESGNKRFRLGVMGISNISSVNRSSFDSQLLIRVRSKEEVTSIKSTDVEGWDSEMFYDLNGRLVENPAHGIYIQNGKKVIFK